MHAYVIQAGDSFDALCARRGANAEEAWNAGENDELRERRDDRHQLAPGDIVHLPEPSETRVELEAETTNRYTAHVPTTTVRFTLREGDDPVANAPFIVLGTHPPIEGASTGEGLVEFEFPVIRREAIVHFTERHSQLVLQLGGLDPASEASGAAHRLRNLGYLHHSAGHVPSAPERAERLEHAVRTFRRAQGLPDGVELDQETLDALRREHDE